jgi:hypothetical protein
MESSLKGKDPYNWPPYTCWFRSAAFYTQNIFFLLHKISYFVMEVNCTRPSTTIEVPGTFIKAEIWVRLT